MWSEQLAPLPLFSACESVAVLLLAMPSARALQAVLRPSRCAAGPSAALSTAGGELEGRSAAGSAASGRTDASGASRRGLRPHCGAAESDFIAGDDDSAVRSARRAQAIPPGPNGRVLQ